MGEGVQSDEGQQRREWQQLCVQRKRDKGM